MMRAILVLVMLVGGCGVVPENAGRPRCDELKCLYIDQWSYTLNGKNVLRVFCLTEEPTDSACDETGCLSHMAGIECQLDD